MNRERIQALAQEIAPAHGAQVLLDERLAPWLSMRAGGTPAAFVKPKDPMEYWYTRPHHRHPGRTAGWCRHQSGP